jgi:hypothetical protein
MPTNHKINVPINWHVPPKLSRGMSTACALPACSTDGSVQSGEWPEPGSAGSAGPVGAEGAAGLLVGEELQKELEAAASIQPQRLW